MKYINVTSDRFKEILEYKVDGKLQMLNLLKFKETVEGTEMTGYQQYQKYMAAAAPFLEKTNAKIIYSGNKLSSIIGPKEEWDKVIIVEYNSKEEFINMITTKGYPSHLREAALLDSRLILCEI